MKKYTFILILVFLISSCNQKTNNSNTSQIDQNQSSDSLTTALEKIQSKNTINGFGVAIVDQNGILYENGIGYADIEKNKAYTQHTLQNIASVSKTLIGVALMKAQEMDALSLDDPINKHLPFNVNNPYFPTDTITIRHLATHTSSIQDAPVYNEQSYILKNKEATSNPVLKDIHETFNPPTNKVSLHDFLKQVFEKEGTWYTKESFLDKKPGSFFEYTNIGATLAALVLEHATGESYDVFTKKHILKPLSMNSSGWSYDDIALEMHSKLYANPKTELPFYSLITYPDGGFITSSHDLGLYLSELIKGYSGKGTILTKDSYQELFRKQMRPDQFLERDSENPYDDEYDFGIFIGFSAKGYVGHTGGDPGVSSFMFFDTEKKIGRLLFINTNLINQEAVNDFFAIWDTLGNYQEKLTSP
ncbi:serine hydrolase domain-containing protein [Flavobacteriaceae bacterium M23B6Z8]